ncbi:MAG: 3-hydroxyacyl-CoA dehydrogenase family protein, partial [Candidatus Thermoplasmatota archaeon]|nr:3-hydroxyacyl-CoA dehydrogenase family protein [Candidatus Thermoplasmatota archaeon]
RGRRITADIDKTFRLGMNHPMGPIELADFIGLDVCYDIMEVLYRDFGNPAFKPPVTLKNMVDSGKLGRKTGQGFYSYEVRR